MSKNCPRMLVRQPRSQALGTGGECRLWGRLHGPPMTANSTTGSATKTPPTAAQRRERAARLKARHEAQAAELAAIEPVMVTPEKAAAMFSVSTAYLRDLEKNDPAFDATWRRNTLVLYDVSLLRRFFSPSPREFIQPVTGGALPTSMIPAGLVPAKVRKAAAAARKAA